MNGLKHIQRVTRITDLEWIIVIQAEGTVDIFFPIMRNVCLYQIEHIKIIPMYSHGNQVIS